MAIRHGAHNRLSERYRTGQCFRGTSLARICRTGTYRARNAAPIPANPPTTSVISPKRYSTYAAFRTVNGMVSKAISCWVILNH
jgi:hypothetical protein